VVYTDILATNLLHYLFLRVTAVPAGTAERVLAMGILSVCLSVRPSICHDPVPIQGQVR